MRLLGCHIENFGRLKDYDRSFDEGCNSIMASNGQGKSTLAAFIRVMFYGFEGEGKRKAGENERKRFEPWQGGVYGGRLSFSDGKNNYTIVRTFGSKVSEDTFELRDESTNLISDAYSQNIGEEIFGVNAESYMRTAYIGQNDVVTHTTDGINAMIGGIADNTGDLDSYEKAVDKLNDLLNKESPTRSTGSLYRLEGDVTTLRTRVREGSVILDSIHRLEDSMGEKRAGLEALTSRRRELTDKQTKLSLYKDKQNLKEKWESVRAEQAEREEEAAVRRAAFPDEIPDEKELAEMQNKAAEYGGLCENVNFYALNATETERLEAHGRRFAAGLPDMNETTNLIRKNREVDKSLSDETDNKAELKVLRNELDMLKRDEKNLPSASIAGMGMILLAMICAVASILIMPTNVLRWIGTAISALILAGGIAATVTGFKRHREDIEYRSKDIERDIQRTQNLIEQGEEYRRSVMEETKRYLDRYGMALDPTSVTEDLRSLHTMADEYLRLKDKKASYDKAVEAKNECEEMISNYLKGLGVAPGGDHIRQLNTLSLDLRSYKEAVERADKAKKRAQEFAGDYDTEELEHLTVPEELTSLGEINEELGKVSEEADKAAASLRDESSRHDELQEKLELWEEDKASLAVKEQQLLDGKRRYKNLKNAVKYLTMAKESITAKYMEPLLTGFSRYYSAVTGTDAGRYHIDANTNITVDELGIQRDTALLSTGYQDLIGFCLRLALVDAMYETEKPILVLDDPFVNLDSERLKGAQRLLDTLAQNYQLIYFTCR